MFGRHQPRGPLSGVPAQPEPSTGRVPKHLDVSDAPWKQFFFFLKKCLRADSVAVLAKSAVRSCVIEGHVNVLEN